MVAKKKTRWQFNLKWMFACVVLVSAYFGSWPWLREAAYRDVEQVAGNRLGSISGSEHDLLGTTTVLPYVVSAREVNAGGSGIGGKTESFRRCYLWLFGWTITLPITTAD